MMWPTTQDAVPMWTKSALWLVGGPRDGVATLHGRFYWFEIAEMTRDRLPTGERYLLIEMTPEEVDDEQRDHAFWEGEFGTLYCYHLPPEQRGRGTTRGPGVAGFLEWIERLFPEGSLPPDYRRFEGREPDFEVTWDRRDLSLPRRSRLARGPVV